MGVWHLIAVNLPPTVPADALKVCTPTLRIKKGRLRVDLPFATAVPFAPAVGHTVAVGFDWGLNTLLTGVVGRLTHPPAKTPAGVPGGAPDGIRVETDGRPLISTRRSFRRN